MRMVNFRRRIELRKKPSPKLRKKPAWIAIREDFTLKPEYIYKNGILYEYLSYNS